jgi:hypothetical protein
MRLFLAATGTAFRLTCPYSSQHNGKGKRIPRTINDCVRTLLIHSAAPSSFWTDALNTATYVINRRPCRATGTLTQHELLLGVPPNYDEVHDPITLYTADRWLQPCVKGLASRSVCYQVASFASPWPQWRRQPAV